MSDHEPLRRARDADVSHAARPWEEQSRPEQGERRESRGFPMAVQMEWHVDGRVVEASEGACQDQILGRERKQPGVHQGAGHQTDVVAEVDHRRGQKCNARHR